MIWTPVAVGGVFTMVTVALRGSPEWFPSNGVIVQVTSSPPR